MIHIDLSTLILDSEGLRYRNLNILIFTQPQFSLDTMDQSFCASFSLFYLHLRVVVMLSYEAENAMYMPPHLFGRRVVMYNNDHWLLSISGIIGTIWQARIALIPFALKELSLSNMSQHVAHLWPFFFGQTKCLQITWHPDPWSWIPYASEGAPSLENHEKFFGRSLEKQRTKYL